MGAIMMPVNAWGDGRCPRIPTSTCYPDSSEPARLAAPPDPPRGAGAPRLPRGAGGMAGSGSTGTMETATTPVGAVQVATVHGGKSHPRPGYFGTLGGSMEGGSGKAGTQDLE